jgi:hypothetical protein
MYPKVGNPPEAGKLREKSAEGELLKLAEFF